MRHSGTTLSAILLSATVGIAAMALPGTSGATEGWDWWDAVYAQQHHKSICPANPPTKALWESTLGEEDDPHWTELTVFFIAYPCSGTPSRFMEFRDWLNYEVHDVGEYDSDWENYAFYSLYDLVYELDEQTAGYWGNGPWN